jgi:uncharacterized protein
MRSTVLTLLFAAVFLLAAAEARAQQTTPPEKAALIKELIELTGAGSNAVAVMNSVIAQVQSDSRKQFEAALEKMHSLTPEEREVLAEKEAEDAKRINDRVMQLFRERIDFKKITEEVSYEIVDKYYTADELKDLIAFYKTPTGQKSIKLTPQIFADTMQKTDEKLLPQLMPIINQVLEEEKQRIEKLTPPPPKPKPRRPQQRRRA